MVPCYTLNALTTHVSNCYYTRILTLTTTGKFGVSASKVFLLVTPNELF